MAESSPVAQNDFSQQFSQVAEVLRDMNMVAQDNADIVMTLLDCCTSRLVADPAGQKILKLASRFVKEIGEDVDVACEKVGCKLSFVRSAGSLEQGSDL